MARYTIKDDTHWGWPTSIVTGKSGNWWIGATHANILPHSSADAYAIKSTDSGHTWGSDVLVDAEDTGYVSISGCMVAVDISPTVRRILCYIQRYYVGTGTYKAVCIYTDDEFVTMSTPVELSADSWVPYGECLTTPLGKILIPVFNYADAWQLAHFKTTDYGVNHTLVAGISDTTNKPYESSWAYLPSGKIRRVTRNFKWSDGDDSINPIMYLDSTDTEGETWDAAMSELPFGYQMDTNLASLKHTDGKYYLFQGVSKGTVWVSTNGLDYKYQGTYSERTTEDYLLGPCYGRPMSLASGKIGIAYHTGNPLESFSNLYYCEYDPTNPTDSSITTINKTLVVIDKTKCGTATTAHFLFMRTIQDTIAADFYNNIKTDATIDKSNVNFTGLKSGVLPQCAWPLTKKNAIVMCDTPLSNAADTQIWLKQDKAIATMDYAGMLSAVGCKAFYPLNQIAGKFSDLSGNYGEWIPNTGLTYLRRYKQFDYGVDFAPDAWMTNSTFGKTDLIDYNKNFSLVFLVRVGDRSGYPIWIGNRAQSAPYAGWLLLLNASFIMQFWMSNTWNTNALMVNAFSEISNNATYHIVVTHTANGGVAGLKIYANAVDQSLTNNCNNLTATISNADDVFLNAAVTGGTNCKANSFSMLKLYNRVLTPSEVTADYNQMLNESLFSAVGTLTDITQDMVYFGNGETGGTGPADDVWGEGDTVTVLGAGTLVKAGYTFGHWNTEELGGGTSYNPGDTFAMPAEAVVLYAQWTANPAGTNVKNRRGNMIGPSIGA